MTAASAFDLSGRTALITGSSRRIGLAIASGPAVFFASPASDYVNGKCCSSTAA